jgi:hypothetical protein
VLDALRQQARSQGDFGGLANLVRSGRQQRDMTAPGRGTHRDVLDDGLTLVQPEAIDRLETGARREFLVRHVGQRRGVTAEERRSERDPAAQTGDTRSADPFRQRLTACGGTGSLEIAAGQARRVRRVAATSTHERDPSRDGVELQGDDARSLRQDAPPSLHIHAS